MFLDSLFIILTTWEQGSYPQNTEYRNIYAHYYLYCKSIRYITKIDISIAKGNSRYIVLCLHICILKYILIQRYPF